MKDTFGIDRFSANGAGCNSLGQRPREEVSSNRLAPTARNSFVCPVESAVVYRASALVEFSLHRNPGPVSLDKTAVGGHYRTERGSAGS